MTAGDQSTVTLNGKPLETSYANGFKYQHNTEIRRRNCIRFTTTILHLRRSRVRKQLEATFLVSPRPDDAWVKSKLEHAKATAPTLSIARDAEVSIWVTPATRRPTPTVIPCTYKRWARKTSAAHSTLSKFFLPSNSITPQMHLHFAPTSLIPNTRLRSSSATIQPKDNGAALVNPGMGWTMHFYSNFAAHFGSKMEPSDALEAFPGESTVYLRVPWSYLEPKEDEYNWALFDTPAQRWIAAGKKVALRVSASDNGCATPPPNGCTRLAHKVGMTF